MSSHTLQRLGFALGRFRELQSDYENLKIYPRGTSFGFDSNFSSLLMSVANFLTEIDKVHEVVNESSMEIERLYNENNELREQIEKLESHIEMCERAGRV